MFVERKSFNFLSKSRPTVFQRPGFDMPTKYLSIF